MSLEFGNGAVPVAGQLGDIVPGIRAGSAVPLLFPAGAALSTAAATGISYARTLLADPTGVVGASSVLQAALNESTGTSVCLDLGPGNYTLDAPLTVSGKSVTIRGAERGVTTLTVTHSQTPLTVTQSSLDQLVTLRGFRAVTTSPTGCPVFADIKYTQVASSWARTSVRIDDVEVLSSSSPGTPQSFLKAFKLHGCWSPRISNCQFVAPLTVPGVDGASLLDLSECFDISVNNCSQYYGGSMVYQSGYCEGIRLFECTTVAANYTLAQAPTGIVQRFGYNCNGVWLVGCENNGQLGGLNLKSTIEVMCTANHWAQWAGVAAGVGFAAYDFTDVNNCTATGDMCVGGANTALNVFVRLRSVTGCGRNQWFGTDAEDAVGVLADFGPGTSHNVIRAACKADGTQVVDAGVFNAVYWTASSGADAQHGTRVFAGSDGQSLATIADVPNAVNIVQLVAGPAGTTPQLSAAGSDTNVGLALSAKGQAGITLNHGGGTLFLAIPGGPVTANYPRLTAATTGNAVVYGATGSDAAVAVVLASKNNAGLQIGATASERLSFFGAAPIARVGRPLTLTDVINTLVSYGLTS